ncbi:hypothetical protein BHF71_04295 [Vulcanibacillus modesticaldus]|uniref:Uncharacterized protein n=1 Tax=Vulcanibacillus modesticaldus TaxID=337097 RepID=A0A1D2YSD2_9BACI|nr:hypothetical protein [Vulcanibacillus modesticaldus]OEF96956.1 hypothetical protein BHF71_04295 [Vulcanibacillus modesticaldus]
MDWIITLIVVGIISYLTSKKDQSDEGKKIGKQFGPYDNVGNETKLRKKQEEKTNYRTYQEQQTMSTQMKKTVDHDEPVKGSVEQDPYYINNKKMQGINSKSIKHGLIWSQILEAPRSKNPHHIFKNK